MPTYIAFLRAVNVAPRWVKMARVNTLLPEHGYAEVATHIQSGNLRVTTPTRGAAKVAAHLRTVLSEEFGFDIPTIVRTPTQLRELVGTVEGVPRHCRMPAATSRSSRPIRRPRHGLFWRGGTIRVSAPRWLGRGDLKVVRTLAEKWGR